MRPLASAAQPAVAHTVAQVRRDPAGTHAVARELHHTGRELRKVPCPKPCPRRCPRPPIPAGSAARDEAEVTTHRAGARPRGAEVARCREPTGCRLAGARLALRARLAARWEKRASALPASPGAARRPHRRPLRPGRGRRAEQAVLLHRRRSNARKAVPHRGRQRERRGDARPHRQAPRPQARRRAGTGRCAPPPSSASVRARQHVPAAHHAAGAARASIRLPHTARARWRRTPRRRGACVSMPA